MSSPIRFLDTAGLREISHLMSSSSASLHIPLYAIALLRRDHAELHRLNVRHVGRWVPSFSVFLNRLILNRLSRRFALAAVPPR